MAPWCPKCGGNWENEGSLLKKITDELNIGDDRNTHWVLIPSGDRVEVICHHCGTTFDYPLSMEDEKKLLVRREAKLYKMIEELEAQLKKKGEKKKNENEMS